MNRLARGGGPWLGLLVLFGIYLGAAAPDLSFYDSAELALVAAQGGLSHPPGQPLHTILGWLLQAPFGASPWLLTVVLSGLPAALTLRPLWRLAGSPRGLPGLAALAWLGALLLHPAWLDNGTRVEVYTLATCLALFGAAAMARALEASSFRRWLLTGLWLGLAASAHPYLPVFVLAGASPALLGALVRRRVSPSALLGALLGGPLGLLPYLYVPWIASDPEAFVWGAPADAASLRFYFTAQDFGHTHLAARGEVLGAHAGALLGWLTSSGLLPMVVVGLVGAFARARDPSSGGPSSGGQPSGGQPSGDQPSGDQPSGGQSSGGRFGGGFPLGPFAPALALALTTFVVAGNLVFDMRIPDYQGYLLPALALAGAAGAGWLARWASRAES